MNRWIIFIGIIASLFVLFQIQSGKISTNEAFQMTTGQTDILQFINSKDKPAADGELSILAFGDIMLGRYVRILMDKFGKDYLFKNVVGFEGRIFEGADVVFGNLEGPIKGAGRKGGTSMVFSFNEDVAAFLKSYGFNLLMIANNHALDQGLDGRKSTIETLEKNKLGWCGHPSEADPDSVYYGKVKRKTFAFICFNDVISKLDDEAALNLIQTVRPNVDFLIVSIHWGLEYRTKPDFSSQISPGRTFIDAGADIIIGHHPHVVQGIEIYNNRLILYSLGNFVFDQYWSLQTQKELAVKIILNDEEGDLKTKVYLYPLISILSQPRLLSDEEYKKWVEEFLSNGEYSEELKEQIRNGIISI